MSCNKTLLSQEEIATIGFANQAEKHYHIRIPQTTKDVLLLP
jgi:hypothetical protein